MFLVLAVLGDPTAAQHRTPARTTLMSEVDTVAATAVAAVLVIVSTLDVEDPTPRGHVSAASAAARARAASKLRPAKERAARVEG